MIRFEPFCKERTASSLRCFPAALSDWRSRRHGFETALVSAAANWALMICFDVTDISSDPIRAPVNFSMNDDARADASPDFHPNEVLQSISFPGVCLPDRHNIYIIIHHYGCVWKRLSKEFLDGKVFPRGHQRRCDQHTLRKFNGTGHADSNCHHLCRNSP